MKGSTALVTGANKGIGKEIARQLAAEGCTVYVGARDLERGNEAAAEIGGDAHALQLDVTDADSIGIAARRISRLDVLINNAGIMVDSAAPPEAEPEAFRRTYETNVFGVLAVTNAFLPALRRSSAARIVNVSSGTGSLTWSGDPRHEFAVSAGSAAAYRSSKAASNALTLFYAQALAADGIPVNALAPGLRRTDLNERAASSDGDPGEAAAGVLRLVRLPPDGPTGGFFSWDGTPVPW